MPPHPFTIPSKQGDDTADQPERAKAAVEGMRGGMERIHKLCEEQSLMPPAELSVLRSALARPAEDSLAHFSSVWHLLLPPILISH